MASLEFYLDLPEHPSPNLVPGYLLIKSQPGSAGIKVTATSGCRGHQYSRSWNLKGRGPLPPSDKIAPLGYRLSTQRLWLPTVVGVEGSFFPISPFAVPVAAGMMRGDFGIHFDANVPGSAGCCVIPFQEHWDIFRGAMQDFRAAGLQQISLKVVYP